MRAILFNKKVVGYRVTPEKAFDDADKILNKETVPHCRYTFYEAENGLEGLSIISPLNDDVWPLVKEYINKNG